jgi:hypothetical protein
MVAGTDSYKQTEKEKMASRKMVVAIVNGRRPIAKAKDNHGLTKREYMATHIMAGFGATQEDIAHESVARAAEYAVEWADALLLALEN